MAGKLSPDELASRYQDAFVSIGGVGADKLADKYAGKLAPLPKSGLAWGTHPEMFEERPTVRPPQDFGLGINETGKALLAAPERARRLIAETPAIGPMDRVARVVAGGAAKAALSLPLIPLQVASQIEEERNAGTPTGEAVARGVVGAGLSLTGLPDVYRDLRRIGAIEPGQESGPLAREEVAREFATDPVGKLMPYAMAAGTVGGLVHGLAPEGAPESIRPEVARLSEEVSRELAPEVTPTPVAIGAPERNLEEMSANRHALEAQVYKDLEAKGLGGRGRENIAGVPRKELSRQIAEELERRDFVPGETEPVPHFMTETEPQMVEEPGMMGKPVKPGPPMEPGPARAELAPGAGAVERRGTLKVPSWFRDLEFTEGGDLKTGPLKTGDIVWPENGELAEGKYIGQAPGPGDSVILKVQTPAGQTRYFHVRPGEENRIAVRPRLEPEELGAPGPASPSGPAAPGPSAPNRAVPLPQPQPTPAVQGAEAPRLNPHDVRRFLEEKLTVPIRRRMFRGAGKTVLGVYKPRPEVVRAFRTDDLPTIAHEVGHYLDDKLGLRTGSTPAAKAELLAAGKRLYGSKKPTGGYVSEGVAEFHSFLLTDPARAAREFPHYQADYSARLAQHPEIRQVLDQAREMVSQLEAQSPLEEVRSRIRSRAELRRPTEQPSEFIRKWYDDLLPLKHFDEAVSTLNPGRAVRLYDRGYQARNWSSLADEIANERMVDARGNTVGPSAKAILRPVRNDLQDLDAYLIARATQERNPLGKTTGLSETRATDAISELQAQDPKRFAAIQTAANGLYRLQDQMLQLAVDEGLLTAESAKAMRETYAAYAPMYRFVDEGGAAGGPGGIGGSLYRRAKGGEQEILRPTENILKNIYALAYRVGQQRIGRELLYAARNVKGAGRFVEEVPLPMEPRNVTVEEAIDSIRKDNPEVAQALSELPEDALEGVVTAFRPSSALARRKGLFVVSERGKPVGLQLGDPVLRDTLLGLTREQIPEFARRVGQVTSLMRLGATAANPEFMPVNFTRDQVTALLNSDYGFLPVISPLRGLPHMLSDSPLWQEYRLSGAQQAQLLQLDKEYLGGGIADALAGRDIPSKAGLIGAAQRATRSGIQIASSPLRAVVRLNQATENLTRFAEYRLAREKGADPLAAMRAAQEVTVNFQRVGANMRAVSLMSPFYKANVNALGRLGATVRAHPARTAAKTMIGVAIPAAILYAANSSDPDYEKIPQRVRDLYFLMKIAPGKWLRLPKPDLPGVLVGGAVERALAYFRHRDPGNFALWAADTLKSSAPGVYGLPMPSPVTTAVEQLANYSLYWDAPIVPPSKTGLVPELQARPSTGPTARRLARATGYPAAKIEQLVGGTFGGVGTMALRASDLAGTATGILEKPPKSAGLPEPYSASRLPIVRRFIQELPPAERRSALTEQQWKDRSEGESLLASWRELMRNGTAAEKDAFVRRYGAKLSSYLESKRELDNLAKQGKEPRRPLKLQDALRALESR